MGTKGDSDCPCLTVKNARGSAPTDTDRPNFVLVFVFGTEKEDFDYFRSIAFSDENVHLDNLQSTWQRPSKRIKWETSVIVTVDGCVNSVSLVMRSAAWESTDV